MLINALKLLTISKKDYAADAAHINILNSIHA
jgi:hypothetical protein